MCLTIMQALPEAATLCLSPLRVLPHQVRALEPTQPWGALAGAAQTLRVGGVGVSCEEMSF